MDIPKKLYHATYSKLLPSIRTKGLGALGEPNWEDSEKGVVYLARDKEVAFSYAEVSDIGWGLYEDEDGLEISLLEINTSQLDQDKFDFDRNVLDSDSTLEYRGVIPFRSIKVLYSRKV